MKKFISILLILLFCFVPFLTSCNKMDKDASECIEYEKIEGKDEYRVKKILIEYKSSDIPKELIVSSKYKGKPVTEIGEDAFRNTKLEHVVSIKLPETIVKIGEQAFTNLNILEINIPSSVRIIEKHAFELCKNVEVLNIPEGVTTIKFGAFFQCKNLKEVTIPRSVTLLNEHAFFSCYKLEKVNLHANITSIPENCFGSIDNIKELNITSPIESIAVHAFEKTNIEKFVAPSTLKELDMNSFHFSNIGTLDLSKTDLKEIKDQQFCVSSIDKLILSTSFLAKNEQVFPICMIKEIDINNNPNFVIEDNVLFSKDKKILYRAFLPESVTNYQVPDSVEIIAKLAFYKNDSLVSIHFTKNIKNVFDWAFFLCDNIREIHLFIEIPTVGANGINAFIFKTSKISGIKIYLNHNVVPTYWNITSEKYDVIQIA